MGRKRIAALSGFSKKIGDKEQIKLDTEVGPLWRKVSSISIGGSINFEGFLSSILLSMVIIVTVVIVVVILIVVVDDVSLILKLSFAIIGSLRKDKGPTQEYILLPLQPHRTRILVEDIAPAAHEKPSKSSPKDNDVQNSKDVVDKEGQHQMTEDEQVLHDDLEKMIAQEVVDTALDDVIRQAFEEEKRNIVS
ncbi:hypothetical protein Tco_0128965 [Tanacetum coccineum]